MSGDPPKVTIGLPVYNSERFLAEALESLLGQTYTNFQLVISDNASTDGTAQLCRDYERRDQRVRYHRNPVNIGLPGNFNRIVELCDTPFLKWSTADDYWAPTMLEKCLQVLETDASIALCYPKTTLEYVAEGRQVEYEDNLHLMQDDPVERLRALLQRIELSHRALGVIRMQHLKRTRLFAKHRGADINLLAELSLYGKFFELPERLYFRRFHDQSYSWKRDEGDHARLRYYSEAEGAVDMRTWRRHLMFMSSVPRARLGLASQLRAARFLGQRMYWSKPALIDELKTKLASLVTSR